MLLRCLKRFLDVFCCGWQWSYLGPWGHKVSPSKFYWGDLFWKIRDTVDGRNPAPVDMVNIPLFTRFHAAVQDFFHQQYESMKRFSIQ